jgi:hypothetical protein
MLVEETKSVRDLDTRVAVIEKIIIPGIVNIYIDG